MPITKSDVKYIANLARLKLTEKETEYFTGQLSNIIGYVDQLKELDTANIEPTTHAMPIQNVFREDTVKPSLKVEDALNNAPAKENSLFKVPRIIEEA
ncbi:MAG: Asp-tRNA(Asn)/Glu-tRNA(Gln) amidotransferase subunit GatC [Candidatus Omnitrophota bacterium]|nr:Asp-tRNA(Asn)/Glu-tRNA(Gln) amidotransferase subunit GatC [Candidatus Omnitrophota bacterium]